MLEKHQTVCPLGFNRWETRPFSLFSQLMRTVLNGILVLSTFCGEKHLKNVNKTVLVAPSSGSNGNSVMNTKNCDSFFLPRRACVKKDDGTTRAHLLISNGRAPVGRDCVSAHPSAAAAADRRGLRFGHLICLAMGQPASHLFEAAFVFEAITIRPSYRTPR